MKEKELSFQYETKKSIPNDVKTDVKGLPVIELYLADEYYVGTFYLVDKDFYESAACISDDHFLGGPIATGKIKSVEAYKAYEQDLKDASDKLKKMCGMSFDEASESYFQLYDKNGNEIEKDVSDSKHKKYLSDLINALNKCFTLFKIVNNGELDDESYINDILENPKFSEEEMDKNRKIFDDLWDKYLEERYGQ